jgi:bifunctional non-homologous end joining protein LigD
MASDKPGRSLRSLLLGYYDRGKLVFARKAGFGLAAGRDLAERLRKIERDMPPFASAPVPISVAPAGSPPVWSPR